MTVTDFRGKTLVSIREYYSKEGKELPTSKGNNHFIRFFIMNLHTKVHVFSFEISSSDWLTAIVRNEVC